MTTRNELDALDNILHDAALVHAHEGRSTPAERKRERQIVQFAQSKVAELRRARTLEQTDTPEPAVLPPIRPSLLAMTRDALLARIAELLTGQPGAVQYAHRDLTGLDDDDLRGAPHASCSGAWACWAPSTSTSRRSPHTSAFASSTRR
jgi:hypothetical protein